MTENTKRDYKDTVFLPKTDFPMKAGLPQKEPGIAERWDEIGMYERLREARTAREKFILHDGPPYANGDMHIGHALNHVLKDAVVRTQTLLGKDAPYVPGWDCHGLPIEWKVEEQYRKKKRDKKDVPPAEFRAECRQYAAHWVEVQKEQLKRLGIGGRWDKPYLTMRPEAEAQIVRELHKFAETGQLYRGAKPVMWSPVEETALADAEVEYHDLTDSPQIDVAFEIMESPIAELVGAHAVIWTTTPWTIPVNQALAYGRDVEYELLHLNRLPKEKRFGISHILVASDLKAATLGRLGIDARDVLTDWQGSGSDLAGTMVRHPMQHLGGFYATPRPLLAGDFVTTDSGTGLVHMSPDHGEDDFELCRKHGIDPVFAVMADGRYRDDWPWLGGDDERRRSVINKPFNAPDGPICSDLREAGALLSASADYRHSYPHSWRSKAKVVYRCTPQWFIAIDEPKEHLDGKSLRETAMQAIADTRFIPAKGRNRLASMVEGRPDWLISRQRAWGVPIALFVHRETGKLLVDREVNERIAAAISRETVDAWHENSAAEFLGPDRNPEEFEMVTDILDVWFDSGSTHAFVLESEEWPELSSPADLYLEGSDQHRGWFQSSLLESCGTRGHAPYKSLLTHGFTMDAKGMKMSKSLGNTVNPLTVMEQYGADIIRLWALTVDYTEDHRIGEEILKGVGDQYRKLRNTFRYLLGALPERDELHNGTEKGSSGTYAPIAVGELPELERYMLGELAALDERLRQAVADYDFGAYVRALTEFASEDLSAFYFDIRKDCLYCDGPADPKREAYLAVLDVLFHALVRYAAPVLVFTAEEVWTTRYPQTVDEGGSVHLLEWPVLPDVSGMDTARWEALRALREDVMEAIEPLRREKIIRSGLEAEVTVPESAVPAGFDDAELAELFITASVERGQEIAVTKTDNHKCGRCWRLLPSVPEDGALCDRCEDVVAQLDEAA
ncbi:isoleucine--tRNA ligase [Altererythrobacter aurantiacus]|uniref:Isoleucine--tRNA ligase n=1 Tax=Parapontixanthobacter aurantiacus TaxID=1463599 RepID=A0A844ZH80_9SPHN|nr:isoleucine--tRNA ligase [Parapontixanthobacter aurantiacus]MXO86743.1 isoleucine--tRNA ligase [Parapontixanthobacter aurantiacus]